MDEAALFASVRILAGAPMGGIAAAVEAFWIDKTALILSWCEGPRWCQRRESPAAVCRSFGGKSIIKLGLDFKFLSCSCRSLTGTAEVVAIRIPTVDALRPDGTGACLVYPATCATVAFARSCLTTAVIAHQIVNCRMLRASSPTPRVSWNSVAACCLHVSNAQILTACDVLKRGCGCAFPEQFAAPNVSNTPRPGVGSVDAKIFSAERVDCSLNPCWLCARCNGWLDRWLGCWFLCGRTVRWWRR